MSNFIEEFDRINTPDESLKDSIIDIIESTLVDAPKGRTISDDAVFQVAERAIVASASLEPDVQYFNAVREVQNFLTLALEGPSTNGQMSHTDLLPLGHPSSTAQHDLPPAALRTLTANWIASDPRIKSDEARSIVAAVYASNPYSVDYAFNMVRLQSLAADEVPVELTLQPLVAFGNPYAGKNSAWHRRMRANRQRRDDEGQFAEMGGGIRFYVRKGSGIYSIVGKVAGIPENDPNGIDIEVTGVKGFKDGVYTVPSEITHTFKAILPEHSVSNLVPMAKNSNVPFVDIKDLQRKDLPTSWFSSKNVPNVAGLTSKATPSRNFETGDGYQASLYSKADQKLQKRIEEAQQKFGAKVVGQFGTDQLNPDKPVYELVSTKRGQAEVVGYAQDWASVQQLATQEDKDFPDSENEPIGATETKPAIKAEVPEAEVDVEPEAEDIPVEVYEPVDPDANMPEGWVKFDDGTYQSEDGKNLVEFGVGSVGNSVTELYDPVSGLTEYITEPITIQDTFSVYDLNASQMMGTPVGVGFSWSDVQDIITSAENDMPVEPWDPDAVDNIEPAFMMFDDFEKFETLQQEVRDAAQYYLDKVNPDADASTYVAKWLPEQKKSGLLWSTFDRAIITSPAVGELFDDMVENPQNYTQAEAAAFVDIVKARSTPNPVRVNNYPAFMRKVGPSGRNTLKKFLDAHQAPEDQAGREAEIRANLYNYTTDSGQDPIAPILNEVNSWPWKPRQSKTKAQDVADQKNQPVPTPEFLVSDVTNNRPTPAQIVKVESLLRNRLIQDLIDDGDDEKANYPEFQKAFRNMPLRAVEFWIDENKDAPFKPGYVPVGTDKYYTNRGAEGATSRQLASLERKIERRPGLLSDEEIEDILTRHPDMTEREIGTEFIGPLQPRERDYVQTLVNERIANGQPIDDIELVDGVVLPENYVPTFNLDGTPIGTPTSAPTLEDPLPINYVNPEDITYGDPLSPRVVVDNVAKVTSDIVVRDDGSYEIFFDDGTSKTYDATEPITTLDENRLAQRSKPAPEPMVLDTREDVQFDYRSIWEGTKYDTRSTLVFGIDDKTKLTIPDNIGGFIVQAVAAGLPIDQMVLPDWYQNKDDIEFRIASNNGEHFLNRKFTLENYKPLAKLTPEQEDQLSYLVSSFNAYVGFAELDEKNGKKRIAIIRQMAEIVDLASEPDNWWMFNGEFVLPMLNKMNPIEVEEGGTDYRKFEDERVATEITKKTLQDLAELRAMMRVMQGELADALSDRVVTAQGRKLIQGAIKDLSILQPKMHIRNKNLPTRSQVNEVFATIRDGLIDAGNVQTYGKLNRPSKAMLERLTELSSYFNEAIGEYRAGAITSTPDLMEFEDDGKPRMKRFDPPAFIGPELEGLRDAKTFQEVADFLYSRDIYVFDFETTGLFNPIDPEIKNDPVQMAIVKISNGKIADQMSTFINPDSKIGAWTLANVGDGQGGRVNRDFLRKQPSKREAMQMFLDNVPEGAIIAGHNGFLYDIEVLNRTLTEAGLPEFKYGGFIDTLGLARYMMPKWSHQTPDAPFKINDYGQQVPSNTLESLVNYFGLSNNGRHEADADVVSTYEVLKNMLQRGIDGKPVAGPEFDYQASTNDWDQEEYEFHSEEFKARMAEYVAQRAVQLFTTQGGGDGSAEAAELIKNTLDRIRSAAASQSEDESRPMLMAFEDSEPKKPTKAEQAKVVKQIDASELDTSEISPSPTSEGLRIIKAAILGKNVAIQAFAGTGKTTVLRAVAETKMKLSPKDHGLYVVYNKHNQLDADQTMPGNVENRTFGSVAYRAQVNADIIGKLATDEYNGKKEINPDLDPVYRKFAGRVRDMFGFKDVRLSNGVMIPALEATRMVVAAVDNWVLSADMQISKKHFIESDVPFIVSDYQNKSALDAGELDGDIFPEKQFLRMAKMIWFDITSPLDESTQQLVVTHEDLIKNLQLTEPNLAEGSETGKKNDHTKHGLKRIPKFILIDEAQDMNPATFDIFQKQTTKHNNNIQIVVVGDTFQQIYGFRGTIDALSEIGRDVTLPLTISFRYGAKIARLANKVLSFLGIKTDIKGNPDIDTEIMDTDPTAINYESAEVDAIIARTNYGVLSIPMLGARGMQKVAVTPAFRNRHKNIAASLDYLRRKEKNPAAKRPGNMYQELKPYQTYSEFMAAVNTGDKEAKQIYNLMTRLQNRAKGTPLAEKGPIGVLEAVVDSIRAAIPGFSMPEVDEKTKKIPKTGGIGNGLKYEIVGDTLRISDTGESSYKKTYRKIPIWGTFNNKGMLKTEGYKLVDEPSGRVSSSGAELKNYFYDKPIEGKDKLASATKMLEDLVAALSGTDAEVFATNAHGAKGLEYDNVVIWDDFENPQTHADRMKADEEKGVDTSSVMPEWQSPEEIRLAYVALTRAKNVLYPGSLGFYVTIDPKKAMRIPTESNRPDVSAVESKFGDSYLYELRNEIAAELERYTGSSDAWKFPESYRKTIADLEARLADVNDKIAKQFDEDDEPQLMSFDGEPGEFNYEAYNQEAIANLEKSISDAEDQLRLPIEDREDALTNSQINEYIASLNQQIADIKADPDYFRKIDESNLATAKEALQQLLAGNLDPKLLTYAERWALRSPNSVGSSPVVKNRNMILGLRAKIEELSLRLGESNGEQTIDPLLMAFDAADNIDDNQAVTPKPGAPGSDENPIKVDLTEEIKSVNKSNQEVVSTVVASILEAMEKGIIPWKKPWSDEGGFLPTSGATGRVYRGLNLLALMAVGMNRDYKGTRWYTKNAISKLGGYVNKREDGKDPGVIITFVSTKKYDKEEQVQVPDPDNPDKTKTETRTVTKKFAKMGLDIVYNEDEIQGVELPKIVRKDPPAISEVEGIVLDSYTDKPPIEYMPQDSAYWSPTEDVIRLPLRNQFNSTEEHLDTLFHELTHSTGHQNRLDRKDLLANYGTHKDVRAREELIAEIGSAILAQMMNVNTSIDNVAAYVQSWAEWLKGDPNALHEAASLASKAVEHILGGYWASVDGMVDLNEETEAKEVQAIDMPEGEITGEDGTSGGLGKGINYRIEGESVILMGNTSKYKDLIKGVGIVPEGKKRPFSFIFHGRNKYWFVTLSGETGLGDRMRILAELKKKLDDETVTPA